MAAPTVPVTIKLSSQDGIPYPNTVVTAKLDRNDVYQGFVISDEVSGTTDDLGMVVLHLFPNNPETGLGTTGSIYTFKAFPVGGKAWKVTAQIPNVTACNLEDVIHLDMVDGLSEAEAAAARAQLYAIQAAQALPVFSTTPPENPSANMQWIDANSGRRFTWIVDADSGQWVETGASIQIGYDTAVQAAESAADAAQSADKAVQYMRSYLGSHATPPTTDSEGNPLLEGAMYWSSTYDRLYTWDGSTWIPIASAAGGGGDDVFYENDTTVTTSYTISTGKNAMSAGPISINPGVTLTVPTGSTLTIL